MRAKPEYRDRDKTEVAVLDALAECNGDGMTVFDLRAVVEVDIDSLETALAKLKGDGLIEVTRENDRTIITVNEFVVGPDDPTDNPNFFEQIRRRFRL